MNEPVRDASASGFSRSGYNYRLYITFLIHVLFSQAIVGLARLATSYRSLELGFSVEALGVITGSFALLPIFLAVPLGRWLDKGKDAQALRAGSLLMVVSCLGFWIDALTEATMIFYMLLMGVGYLFIMAGQQTLAIRCAEPRNRDSVFGTYMVGIAVGQGIGPIVVGVIARGTSVAPSSPLFGIAAASAVIALAISFLVQKAPAPARRHGNVIKVPLKDLLAIRGFMPMMLASVITVTSLDLLVVYMPLMGAERQIDASVIGMLLTVRTGVSVATRAFFSPLVRKVGRVRLMVICLLMSGAAFAVFVVPSPVWLMILSMTVTGVGLGIATALALSSIVDLAPPEAQGTAVTLRITGNRVGQVALPLLAGVAASATGAAGVLGLIGLSVAASGLAVFVSQRRK